jgi:hypothetical protein
MSDRNVKPVGIRLAVCVLPVLLLAAPTRALDFKWSGFVSGVIGDAIGGSHQQFLGYDCPCFIANWEYAGVYDRRGPMVAPESLGGLQGSLQLTHALTATAQIVARASTERVTADWAYLSYTLDSHWQLQAGRQRLPLYSDSAYIGYTYPWVRPAPEVYGWEIYDYDGGAVVYQSSLGSWWLHSSAYTGRRSIGNDVMESKVTYGYQVNEAWNKIIGAYVELSDDIFNARLVYQDSKVDRYLLPPGGPVTEALDRTPQQFVDFALGADYRNFILRSEVQSLRQVAGADFDPFSYLLSGGYRHGRVTGMLTHAWYYERYTTGDPQPQRFRTDTVSLRWDFRKSWDAKLQFDMFHDFSSGPFLGGSRLLTVAVDTVF